MWAAARWKKSRAPSGAAREKHPLAQRTARRARAESLAYGGAGRAHVQQGRRDARDPLAGARRALGDHRGVGAGRISCRPVALVADEGVGFSHRLTTEHAWYNGNRII